MTYTTTDWFHAQWLTAHGFGQPEEQVDPGTGAPVDEGECPLCSSQARPFVCEGFDGYVTACEEHAAKVLVDAIVNDPEWHEETP